MRGSFWNKFIFLFFAIILWSIAISLRLFSTSERITHEKPIEKINLQLEKQLKSTIEESEEYFDCFLQNPVEGCLPRNAPTYRSSYIFQNGRRVFWTDYKNDLSFTDLRSIRGYGCIDKEGIKQLIHKADTILNGRSYAVVSTVLLWKKPKISNKFLKTEFNTAIFYNGDFELLAIEKEDSKNVIKVQEMPLFQISLGSTYTRSNEQMRSTIFWLVTAGILCFIIFVIVNYYWQLQNEAINKAFYTTSLLLIGLRVVILLVQYPSGFIETEIFNPRYYASSFINPSLGDLLINTFLLLVLTLLFSQYIAKDLKFLRSEIAAHEHKWYLAVLIVLLFVLGSFLYHFSIGLSLHSQWSMDITRDFGFSWFKMLSYTIFILAAIIYFLVSHFIFGLIDKLQFGHKQLVITLAIIYGIFVLIGVFINTPYHILGLVVVTYFLLVNQLHLNRYLSHFQYLTFMYLFVGALPTGTIMALSVKQHYKAQIATYKDRIADEVTMDNDVYAEYLLSEAKKKIADDVFIKNRIFSPYTSKEIVVQKVNQLYLPSYFSKYDSRIYIFNRAGQPFDQGETIGLIDLVNDYQSGNRIEEGLYYTGTFKGRTVKKYLLVVPIQMYDQDVGFVCMELSLKSIIPHSVFPLLLREQEPNEESESIEYNYAILENSKVIHSYGGFNYFKAINANQFDLDNEEHAYKTKNHWHYRFNFEPDKIVIVSFEKYKFIDSISNFSFYFLLLIFFVLIVAIGFNLFLLTKNVNINYASKIQLFLNVSFFTPLLLISISNVSLTIKNYRNNIEEYHTERARYISENIVPFAKALREGSANKESITSELNEVSKFAELDITLFSRDGRLLSTTQPLVYEANILSNYINPKAYFDIVRQLSTSLTIQEVIGDLTFNNTYMPVNSYQTGEILGVVSIPYFDSGIDLEKQIAGILTNIINIFTLIFISFLLISYLMSRWLTYPLRILAEKVQRTTLSEVNEPLEWHSDDEFGLLVDEYNNMLVNLEQSKKALARSEKEIAWQEMARQVAHEIKNPLTPMKLTLQHMQRTIREGNGKTSKQIDTLLSNIEVLSDIATSFSAFAKMPIPENHPFDVLNVLDEATELYSKKELGEITLIKPDVEQLIVNGDKKWIGRAISNIIINASQSAPSNQEVTIIIEVTLPKNDEVLIKISDNGTGIPEEIQGKVFLPNFSTKFSGSGLGLAIAKRAIEHAEGEICFETEMEKGTTFFIQLPLVR